MNYRIEIRQDTCVSESPRERDNLGTMVCWHRRYNLGDDQPKISPDAYWIDLIMDDDKISDSDYYEMTSVYGWSEFSFNMLPKGTMNRVKKLIDQKYIVLPLYLYDHSGITMNTTGFYCPWDSGQVGFIYVSVADVKKEWKWERMSQKRREFIERILEAEVKTYDQYLTGDVWGYEILDENDDQVDSCWGYYGEEYCMQEARESLRYLEGALHEN